MVVSASDWIKGISLSIIASIIGGASKLALRKSFLLEEETVSSSNLKADTDYVADCNDDGFARRSKQIRTLRLAAWVRLSGMFGMTVLNPLCGVLAVNFASPSIVAPFAGVTLVWIVLFAETLIGERPSYKQVFAASLIVFGEVIIAIYGDHTNDEGVTLAELEQSYREPAFRIFLCILAVWLTLIFYWMDRAKSPVLKRFAWGVSGGTITGLQNFVKDWLTIIKAQEGLPWYFFPFLFLAMGAGLSGLLMLTGCMKRYDATYSASTFVGSFVITASIMSAVHYNTFANLESTINYIMYPVGLLILMAGLWVLVQETKGEVEVLDEENGRDDVTKSVDLADEPSDNSSRLLYYLGLSLVVQEIRACVQGGPAIEEESLLHGRAKESYNGV